MKQHPLPNRYNGALFPLGRHPPRSGQSCRIHMSARQKKGARHPNAIRRGLCTLPKEGATEEGSGDSAFIKRHCT